MITWTIETGVVTSIASIVMMSVFLSMRFNSSTPAPPSASQTTTNSRCRTPGPRYVLVSILLPYLHLVFGVSLF
ncbi:hypothetical protein B0H13DRAFT_1979765 [Mycena leptocephala]|nr:hypothetical protein B0H13DRAFT_1979765 [Mycena leptocephala]